MRGKEPAGGSFVSKGQKTRNTAVIGHFVLNARLAWRCRGHGHAGHLVASLHVDSILCPDLLAGGVVGNQDTRHLAGMVLVVVQRATRAAGLQSLSGPQKEYRRVAGMDLAATDTTLITGQHEPAIGEVGRSRDDSQKHGPDEHVSYPHWLTPFARCLTSPYHFQMA